MTPEQQVELLAEAEAALLSAAKTLKVGSPVATRMQPLALVLGRNTEGADAIGTVTVLDLSQHIPIIRQAVQQVSAYAFAFIYDGVIVIGGARRDALLAVSGIRGESSLTLTATAHPYFMAGLGARFGEEIDAPGIAEMYRAVFEDGPTLLEVQKN